MGWMGVYGVGNEMGRYFGKQQLRSLNPVSGSHDLTSGYLQLTSGWHPVALSVSTGRSMSPVTGVFIFSSRQDRASGLCDKTTWIARFIFSAWDLYETSYVTPSCFRKTLNNPWTHIPTSTAQAWIVFSSNEKWVPVCVNSKVKNKNMALN